MDYFVNLLIPNATVPFSQGRGDYHQAARFGRVVPAHSPERIRPQHPDCALGGAWRGVHDRAETAAGRTGPRGQDRVLHKGTGTGSRGAHDPCRALLVGLVSEF